MTKPIVYQDIPPASTGGATSKVVIVDGVMGLEIAIADGVLVPAGTRALLIAGEDSGGVGHILRTNPDGTLAFSIAQPTTGTITPVPQNVASVTLLASNANRKGATFYNNTTVSLFLKEGPGASSTDFTVRLTPGALYELAFPVYTGIVTGIWSAAGGGTAQVTERT